MTELTCKNRIHNEYKSRMSDLKTLWKLYNTDSEAYDNNLGNFNEYGLSFDYVSPNTFKNQSRGYFRYQLSWGGPSDEFRFYADPIPYKNYNSDYPERDIRGWKLTGIYYSFLDWFDGAKIRVNNKTLREIFSDFDECETLTAAYNKAMESMED